MDPRGHVYEDFEPPHRMVREPPTHILSVDLSAEGFKKDHIRVQLVHSHRRLIVHGERHVAGNRWRRFRLEFKLPDGCDTKGIQARFEKGVVRVIMPGLKPVDAAGQQERASPAAKADAAAAASGVRGGAERQDGGRPAPAPPADAGEEFEKNQKTKVQKQESGRQQFSSAKDGGGRDNDDAASEGGEAAAAAPSSRQGYAFLHDRKKMATTVLGVVLVLISFGIYVRYSLAP